MTEILTNLVSLAGGFGAGVVFFGGLWLTVRRLDKLRHPAPVILLSSIARTAFVLGAFWWLSRGHLLSLALCLAGFLAARFVLVRKVQSSLPADAALTSGKNESCT